MGNGVTETTLFILKRQVTFNNYLYECRHRKATLEAEDKGPVPSPPHGFIIQIMHKINVHNAPTRS